MAEIFPLSQYRMSGAVAPVEPSDGLVEIHREWVCGLYDTFTRSVHTWPSDSAHDVEPSFSPTCWCALEIHRHETGGIEVRHAIVTPVN